MGGLQSSWDAPTPAQMATLSEGRAKLAKALAELEKFLTQEVAPFRQAVKEEGISLLPETKVPSLPAAP